MTLLEKINAWMQYPNALGSEAQAAVLVGEVAAKLGEKIPENINSALKLLSLRGTMRDIAAAIARNEEYEPNPFIPSFHDIVDVGSSSCGLSWAEALAVISKYLNEQMELLG